MEPRIILPTKYGEFEVFYFKRCGQEGAVILSPYDGDCPFVRIHSSCLFSESLRATNCDCSRQLESALRYIGNNGGVVFYLYQEGRGIGLEDKIKAISLEQNEGVNTAEAFDRLGHPKDPRNYDAVISILQELNIKEICIGTSNPRKVDALTDAGIFIRDRVHLMFESNEVIDEYLTNKIRYLGHHEKN
ncbi:GTP cyclohydrolase II RibA [Kangiella sp.]|uniref:GTP cyclohydrolase II RibA n=1 Tax=Kangiella sp. TaxID=1920245 RepID=UPI0019992D0F|nr:GTP cyclohydrolase II RibA [Kangiella sp.]MBD3653871.1 GTP cyclohydrolase II RibA [Kangiella sp.]